MPFEWVDFLGLAQELSTQTEAAHYRDARLRTAISRAYYAAYHHARGYLEAKGEYRPPQDSSRHLYVCEQFSKSPDDARRKIGIALNRLRIDRTNADYELRSGQVGGKTAEKDVEVARQIIEGIVKLAPGSKTKT